MTRQPGHGVTTFACPSDRAMTATRTVAAPQAAVFNAWTDPRQVSRWLLGPEGWTMPVCEIDLRPGGAWRYVWRKADGREMEMGGTYREVRAPDRLVWTERWGPEWPETTNTLVLTGDEHRTTMTLTVTYPDQAARDAATRTGMQDGIEASFTRLDRVLETLA